MLSILIPTYNYCVVSLVEALFKEATELNIPFEILVFDDGSNSELNHENETINKLINCSFKVLDRNIGRSAIRNLLAKNASFDNLLFLDADVIPKKNDFIKNYLRVKNPEVVYGGISQTVPSPKKPKKLRWLYTKKREKFTTSSANFYIKKQIFNIYLFDESLKSYGCEDVIFFENLKKDKVIFNYINNPVFHLGNDDANTFIEKTHQAIKNLIFLIDKNKISSKKYYISNVYLKLDRFKLDVLVLYIFKLIKPMLIKNFNSSNPSLFLYDFYRLGYYCLIKNKK
ncbi:glycosyltransferase family 2 protein [Hwangdonia lutea]|uniref:Glycosyltransferase n=1 Tax=Hwangdonia lutea TaxID=3075823 RepID=A0AA97EKX6_9FLAO|nr:glycosyltransferase [Hwangdonia sp. SCSIO 19198]WOD42906.1 glycosyltransferase [Hwangdonia sp. SCSIO 19198]